MSSNKLNVEGNLLLEQPFAKVNVVFSFKFVTSHHSQVPYENLRKIFRTSQRYIEREMAAVQSASSDLERATVHQKYEPAEALKTIDGMIGRVEGLKRKVRTVPYTE